MTAPLDLGLRWRQNRADFSDEKGAFRMGRRRKGTGVQPLRARVLQRKIVWQGYNVWRMLGLGKSAIQRERCMLGKEGKG